jgi:hypothetical protein
VPAIWIAAGFFHHAMARRRMWSLPPTFDLGEFLGRPIPFLIALLPVLVGTSLSATLACAATPEVDR